MMVVENADGEPTKGSNDAQGGKCYGGELHFDLKDPDLKVTSVRLLKEVDRNWRLALFELLKFN